MRQSLYVHVTANSKCSFCGKLLLLCHHYTTHTQVILLGKGRVLYCGDRQDMVPWFTGGAAAIEATGGTGSCGSSGSFAGLGLPYSPAVDGTPFDWVLDLVAGHRANRGALSGVVHAKPDASWADGSSGGTVLDVEDAADRFAQVWELRATGDQRQKQAQSKETKEGEVIDIECQLPRSTGGGKGCAPQAETRFTPSKVFGRSGGGSSSSDGGSGSSGGGSGTSGSSSRRPKGRRTSPGTGQVWTVSESIDEVLLRLPLPLLAGEYSAIQHTAWQIYGTVEAQARYGINSSLGMCPAAGWQLPKRLLCLDEPLVP